MADWQSLAQRAQPHGVDPNIFVRLVRQESGGNPSVTSPAGAYGYTQLMPGTARGLGVNPRDPWQNMLGGARYLKQQLTRFGNYSDALRAYNAGPGAVQQSHGYAETNHYVATILGGTGGPGRTVSTPPGGGTPAGTGGPPAAGPGQPGQLHDPGGGVDVAALLAQLGGQRQPQAPSSMGIQAPAFAAHPVMPSGYQAPSSSGGPAAQPDISQLLALVRTQPGAATLTTPAGSSPAGSAPAGGGGTGAGTTPSTGGGFKGSKVLELIHNDGGKGYGIKNGQVVNGSQVFSAVWGGHANHVHVAAGPQTVVRLGKLAQSMGLHVSENPHFGGVDPQAHVPGSYHVRGEAIDVSGDPKTMNAYSRAVERYNRTHRL